MQSKCAIAIVHAMAGMCSMHIINFYKNEQKSRDAAAKKSRYKRSRDK